MKYKKRFILVSVYIIFLYVLFEGSARVALLTPQISNLIQVENDLYWQRLWIKRHKLYDGVIEIYHGFDMFDQTKGWKSKPDIKDWKVFEDKALNTNSRGFRGKNEYSYGKNQNKTRIMILGDSYTFGEEVSDNETYSYYLQEMIPQSDIINMGIHGYGHDQMLVYLKEEIGKYKPDIVILGFLHIDMERNMLKFRDYAKPKFVLDNNHLTLTASPVPTPEETIKWNWVRPRVTDIISIVSCELKKSSGLYIKEKENVTTAILNEMIKVIDSNDATPVFAYLPYQNEISVDTALTENEKYFFEMCKANDKVNCFSTRPDFADKLAKGAVFEKIRHWKPI
ncbi:MAG: SGNH/GDSL hydrolase family protein, partial [Planctomycetota bacterium]